MARLHDQEPRYTNGLVNPDIADMEEARKIIGCPTKDVCKVCMGLKKEVGEVLSEDFSDADFYEVMCAYDEWLREQEQKAILKSQQHLTQIRTNSEDLAIQRQWIALFKSVNVQRLEIFLKNNPNFLMILNLDDLKKFKETGEYLIKRSKTKAGRRFGAIIIEESEKELQNRPRSENKTLEAIRMCA